LSTTEYAPDAGDLIWTDFEPRVGREQSGRRPALVISPRALWEATRFAIVCPISTQLRGWGTNVALPAGLPVQGEVLTLQVRSIDTLARPVLSVSARVPAAVLTEVRARLMPLLGIEF